MASICVVEILFDDLSDDSYAGVSVVSLLNEIDLFFYTGKLSVDWQMAMEECDRRGLLVGYSSSVDRFDSTCTKYERRYSADGRRFYVSRQ